MSLDLSVNEIHMLASLDYMNVTYYSQLSFQHLFRIVISIFSPKKMFNTCWVQTEP